MPPIDRIVVLMLENQSFDRMLGGLAVRIPKLDGVKPEAPLANPDWPSGAPVFQAPTRARTTAHDPGHDLDNVLRQIDRGSMSGFVADYAHLFPQSTTAERADVMAWYPPDFLPALHLLAGQFVIADHWHSSVPGPTWPNRFFAQSGTSLGHTDTPTGLFHPDLHFYDQRTLYDELNSAQVEWRIYYGDFPQSLAFAHQLEPGNLARYRKFDRFAPMLPMAICHHSFSSSRPISNRKKTTSIRRRTYCAAMRCWPIFTTHSSISRHCSRVRC